jgi:predicted signal transduction protein with EAL and GGDEF domain
MTASRPVVWTATQLAQAVVLGQLELHYQPIVDLRSDQIAGVGSPSICHFCTFIWHQVVDPDV